jgi:hypothetical protein
MYRRILVGITTAVTAVSMVVAPSLTAYAEDVTDQVVATSGSTPIDGNVVSDSGDSQLINRGLVEASGSGTSVTVTGNVDGSAIVTGEPQTNGDFTERIYRGSDGQCTSMIIYDTKTNTGGAMSGVSVTGGASATVGGDITGGANGAMVYGNGSSLTVGGDVKANGQEEVISGRKYTGSDIIKVEGAAPEDIKEGTQDNYGFAVKADAVGTAAGVTNHAEGNGISTDGNGNILVKGDVIAKGTGIIIDTDTNGNKGSITVLGTIKGSEFGIAISDAYSMMDYVDAETRTRIESLQSNGTYEDFHEKFIRAGGTEEEYQAACQAAGERLAAEMPDITIYALESKYPSRLINNSRDNDYYDAYQVAYNKVTNAINYIIRHDDNVTVTANTKTIDAQDYFVAKINQAFEVAADVPAGYMLSGGDNVKVTEKGNGIYELILTGLGGGINVRAVLRPVAKAEEVSYEVEVKEVKQPEPQIQPIAAPTSAKTLAAVTNLVSEADTQSFIAKVSGDKPAQTVAFEVNKIPVTQYKEAVIQNITSAPAGGALNLVTDQPSLMDRAMAEAIMARSDIDVNLVFGYGGKTFKVVIPAGYDVSSLLDANGFVGFLRILAILGGEII